MEASKSGSKPYSHIGLRILRDTELLYKLVKTTSTFEAHDAKVTEVGECHDQSGKLVRAHWQLQNPLL